MRIELNIGWDFFIFFFCFREDTVKLGLAFFPLPYEGQWSFRTVFYHTFQVLRQCLLQDKRDNLSGSLSSFFNPFCPCGAENFHGSISGKKFCGFMEVPAWLWWATWRATFCPVTMQCTLLRSRPEVFGCILIAVGREIWQFFPFATCARFWCCLRWCLWDEQLVGYTTKVRHTSWSSLALPLSHPSIRSPFFRAFIAACRTSAPFLTVSLTFSVFLLVLPYSCCIQSLFCS